MKKSDIKQVIRAELSDTSIRKYKLLKSSICGLHKSIKII